MIKKVILIVGFAWIQFLVSCDMMALISINGNQLSYQDSLAGAFNDPYDFFDFIKRRSSEIYQHDGYGFIYYPNETYQINDSHRWYKTGYGTWYGDGDFEPLDDAIQTVMDENNQSSIILSHARNGTGGEGSHPFWFETNNRTYTFMHNGAISNGLKTALMHDLEETWFQNYPSNWSGIYPIAGSFIDSEIFFHYLMRSILQENSVIMGIAKALNQGYIGGYNLQNIIFSAQNITNFILSDGEKLYIFRNSFEESSYELSYETINDHFIGIKTQTALTTNVKTNTLLEISPNGIIEYTLDFHNEDDSFSAVFDNTNFLIKLSWKGFAEENEKGWNLYRKKNEENFLTASQVNISLLTSDSFEEIEFCDVFDMDKAIYYYWREAVYNDGSTKLYPPLKISTHLLQSKLKQNFPNPFSHSTTFSLYLNRNTDAHLSIYDLLGRKVKSIHLTNKKSGWQDIKWNVSDENSLQLASGVYFYHFKSGNYMETRKMILIK